MLSRPFATLRQHGFRSLHPRPAIRSTSTQAPSSRISRLESRLPAFLRRYTLPLRSAPVSHITAFLLLHEITAIIPLFGLAGAFHYFNWLPPWIAEGALVKAGVEKFGRYLRRKGWIDDGEVLGEDGKKGRVGGNASTWWGRGEGGVRIVVELATAYAVTKILLPVRLVFSVWATPGFAKWTVLPVAGWVRRGVVPVLGRVGGRVGLGGGSAAAGLGVVKAGKLSPAAGTNAVGGGVLPKAGGTGR
ncbi:hypothetical protein Q7P35_004400 [Cladosporium inversicolor]